MAPRKSAFSSAGFATVMWAVVVGSATAQVPQHGSRFAEPIDSVSLFVRSCLAPDDLRESEAAMREEGMQPNPETGTHYHPHFNLSVNPRDGVCSIVIAAEGDAGVAAQAFRDEFEGRYPGYGRFITVETRATGVSAPDFVVAFARVSW